MNRRTQIHFEKSGNIDTCKKQRLCLENHECTIELENKLCVNITKGK